MHGAYPINDRFRVPPPKSLGEVPRYLYVLISTFLYRLFYIFRLVWDTKKSMLLTMLLMALFNGLNPPVLSMIGAALLNHLAEVYAGANLAFTVIATLVAYQFLLQAVVGAVNRVYDMYISISGELVSNHVKLLIMEKAKTIDLTAFDTPDFYARMENANREAGNRPIQVISATFRVLSTVITIVSYIALLFTVSGWMPFCIILTAIPSAVINFVFRRKHVNYMFRRSKSRRQMDYYANTLVNKDLVKEIRMFHLGDVFRDKYQATFEDYFKGLKQLQLRECLWSVGASLLTSAIFCLMYLYLAQGVYHGRFDVGDFSLYTGAITAIGAGVSTLISVTASIYEGTLFINNLMDFLAQKPTVIPLTDHPAPVQRHAGHTIVFEDVSFRYPGGSKDVLQHVNLTIHPGETVVIVGLNGAGKTTLVKLLTRLYDPTSGRILLDGRDIRDYDPDELYRIFGIIFQDFGKYAVSAGENITFGDVDSPLSQSRIQYAAEQSGADAFIHTLPEQYNTPLMRVFEEQGAELSIGQWQKLAIARAFYGDSDVLILDEPTASLDPVAEQMIFQQFNTLRENKTSIFISHRLSSATIADNILVLEGGRIVEQGSHAALMAAKGKYWNLFTLQAQHYVSQGQDHGQAQTQEQTELSPPPRPPRPTMGMRPPRP